MHSEVFVTIGILLGASLLAAALMKLIRVPKVTAYLLVGMFAGPHGIGVVSHDAMQVMEPFAHFAMALVLFNLGSHFPISKISHLGRLIPLSIGEQVGTFAIVAIGLWMATGSITVAVLLGALALATAPATTVLVLDEVQSRGPVTELANGLVVLNNLTCILVFETLMLIVIGADAQQGGPLAAALLLAFQFGGAIMLGLVAGVGVSYFSGLLASKKWLVLVFATSTVLLGVCEHQGYPYMLAFLTMGAVVASFSSEAKQLSAEVDSPTTLLCVVFFVYHGSELDVRSFVDAGLIGVAYIGCRIIGKYAGVFSAAAVSVERVEVRNWLGLTLLAQAGAAIALCTIAVRRDPELGRSLQTIILGSVVFFEIVGPLCIRFGVLQAGEVPLSQAIYHVGHTPLEQARELWSRMCNAFGDGVFHGRSIDQLAVADLMRRGQSITEDASFENVVDHIAHSHDDIFPVVNSVGVPVGIIRYDNINDVLYDPHAVHLICAADLMQPLEKSLQKSDKAAHVIDYLRHSDDDCVLVTDDEEPFAFLGVVRRSDITTMLIQEHKTAQQTPENAQDSAAAETQPEAAVEDAV